MKKTLIISAIVILVLAIAASVFYIYFRNTVQDAFTAASYPVAIEIPKGSTPSQIAKILSDNGLISSERIFLWEVRSEGVAEDLQAGFYTFGEPLNMPQIIEKLTTEGRVLPKKVTIPEGRTVKEISKLLSPEIGDAYKKLGLESKDKINFALASQIPGKSLEGYLFPDTYLLDNLTADALIKRQLERFEQVFTDKEIKKCKELGLTIHQAVTLASIVERESGNTAEMPLVSSVFWNRIKSGWKLESCVTVGYALEKPSTILTFKELEVDSLYNTYKYAGLPPGPICNPGSAAIKAALNPPETKYFFFVATGKGTNDFSVTASEHERKKALYLRNGLK